MPNFFTENKDILFQFENLNINEIAELTENGYSEAAEYDFAPKDYQDAMDNYFKVLEIVGDIAANIVAPNAADVDLEGNHINEKGKVVYAKGIQEALDQLSKAELMGFTLPRKYGGINFPTTIYTIAIEIISRADASLMNIFGLQDIAETINKFGDKDQK
ncbi:MAG: acyl-CoA dehydrogenase family protein, partial [Calditrichaceae bacterium]